MMRTRRRRLRFPGRRSYSSGSQRTRPVCPDSVETAQEARADIQPERAGFIQLSVSGRGVVSRG